MTIKSVALRALRIIAFLCGIAVLAALAAGWLFMAWTIISGVWEAILFVVMAAVLGLLGIAVCAGLAMYAWGVLRGEWKL